MSVRSGAVLAGLVVAGCSSSDSREAGSKERAPERPTAIDAQRAIPDGWVQSDGPGWRAALPVAPAFKRFDAPPPLEMYIGDATPTPEADGAMLNLLRWPADEQRRRRAAFERDLMAGFRASMAHDGYLLVGTFQAVGETCPSERLTGKLPTGHHVDMMVVVCTGAGVVLSWRGLPSRLDEVLAHFVFTPAQVGPP